MAGADLARHLRPGACVILESTTYPGTTTELLLPILAEGSALAPGDFFVGYSPERIDPGNLTHGLVNTPKVVSGADDASLAVVDAFFSALVDQTVPVGSCAEAELVKLLENTFRHVNIALVNELAMFARDLDVDVWRAIDAAATKPFGYMKFTPGPGVGGHCLPIDPSYLAWRVKQHLGHTFRFVELANDVNEHMPDYVHERVTAMLNRQRKPLNGSRVLLLGPGLQEGHQRLARKPVGARRRSAGGERRRGADLRPVHRRRQRPARHVPDGAVRRRRAGVRRPGGGAGRSSRVRPGRDRRQLAAGVRHQEPVARPRVHR